MKSIVPDNCEKSMNFFIIRAFRAEKEHISGSRLDFQRFFGYHMNAFTMKRSHDGKNTSEA